MTAIELLHELADAISLMNNGQSKVVVYPYAAVSGCREKSVEFLLYVDDDNLIWKSVRDELPDEEGEYLCAISGREQAVCLQFRTDDCGENAFDGLPGFYSTQISGLGFYDKMEVTLWRRMPMVPKL